MINKLVERLTLSEAFLFLLLLASNQGALANKESVANQQQQQPLANLDKILKQTNGIKVDALMDPKLTSNVTNTFQEMAMSLGKMFTENRRMTAQMQEVMNRMQNATGLNTTVVGGALANAGLDKEARAAVVAGDVDKIQSRLQGATTSLSKQFFNVTQTNQTTKNKST